MRRIHLFACYAKTFTVSSSYCGTHCKCVSRFFLHVMSERYNTCDVTSGVHIIRPRKVSIESETTLIILQLYMYMYCKCCLDFFYEMGNV